MKPTLFIGVPRVFDRIYAGVYAKVNAGSPLKRFFFNYGYRWKLYYLNQGYAFDKVVTTSNTKSILCRVAAWQLIVLYDTSKFGSYLAVQK